MEIIDPSLRLVPPQREPSSAAATLSRNKVKTLERKKNTRRMKKKIKSTSSFTPSMMTIVSYLFSFVGMRRKWNVQMINKMRACILWEYFMKEKKTKLSRLFDCERKQKRLEKKKKKARHLHLTLFKVTSFSLKETNLIHKRRTKDPARSRKLVLILFLERVILLTFLFSAASSNVTRRALIFLHQHT